MKIILERLCINRSFHFSRRCLQNGPVELNVVNKLREAGSQTAKSLPKDRSLIKLGLWVVIFGSVLTNVIDKKQQYEELERRYHLKIDILQRIIQRLRNGESVDVEDELRLVNNVFERKDLPRYQSPIRRKIREKKAINSVLGEEESLEDIWKDIVNNVSDPEVEPPIALPNRSQSISGEDDIVTDRNLLFKISQQEQDQLKYVSSTNQHVIISTPGEATQAAKDTQMKKYL